MPAVSSHQIMLSTDNHMVVQVSRDKLAHLGTCIGKMTHTGKFRLTIACLDLLAQHAKYKVTSMQFRKRIAPRNLKDVRALTL